MAGFFLTTLSTVGILLLLGGCNKSVVPELPELCAPTSEVRIAHPFGSALFLGDSVELVASVSGCPHGAQQLTWTSSNPAVVTVRSRGDHTAIVRALTPGATRIGVAARFAPNAQDEITVLAGGPAEPTSGRVRSRMGPPPELAPVLVLRAGGSDTLTVVLPPPPCAIFLRAYRTEQRVDPPAWDQEIWFRARAGGCKLPVMGIRIPPSSEAEVPGQSVRVSEILGDSLAPGRYFFSVRLYRGRAPALDLPAGSVDLQR